MVFLIHIVTDIMYSLIPRSNYIPLQTISHNHGLSSALRFRNQGSHQHKTTEKITVSLFLVFMFLDYRPEGNTGPNVSRYVRIRFSDRSMQFVEVRVHG